MNRWIDGSPASADDSTAYADAVAAGNFMKPVEPAGPVEGYGREIGDESWVKLSL
ncbi:hypothetical protein Rhow_001235 [Rhodococcus wratislaviensis]|uniref:Uncharacterized protein n=1 Tax=Rhodococcus wratislaviensis TaxID=44752 RepID=A0A402C3L9_RHOWR|nr:hypothetical protein Rhow_001235 [Rhodococcus wratislaviensis]